MTHRLTRRGLGELALGAGIAAAPAPALLRTALAQPATADAPASLPRPQQAPILTVSGRITRHNQGDMAVFDRSTLEGLGVSSFTTATPWYDRAVRFDGVPMATLLRAVGAAGETVTAIALNDYSTDIPVSDFARYGVLLAMRRDGQPMRVSDKGPLFIVYPYDSSPELKTRQFYSRSAWSVAQLIVR